ncbi:MAG: AbrB family transcriptional regulator [Alphaproteobacteria bacterium]|nr:AbrB family transcriptional regulator [Alphaproteobacteria bacterium]
MLITLLIGAVGGVSFDLLDLPAAYLSGAMLTVAIWAIAGQKAVIPSWLGNISFIATGSLLGAGIDRNSLKSILDWPISLIMLGISMIVLLTLVRLYLRQVHHYDRNTAILCSVPGALSFVVAVASEVGADPRRVAVIQTVRLATVMVLIPVVIGYTDVHSPLPTNVPKEMLDWPEILMVLTLSALGVPLGALLRIPAPYFTAPMLVSGALFISGFVEGAIPSYILYPPLIICGAAIGTRFAGSTSRFLISCAKAGVGATALGLAITSLFAWPTSIFLDLPFMQLWLAFAPGGLEAMTVLAFTLDTDPAFVAGHQIIRFLVISLIVPFLLGKTKDRATDPTSPPPP